MYVLVKIDGVWKIIFDSGNGSYSIAETKNLAEAIRAVNFLNGGTGDWDQAKSVSVDLDFNK